MSSNHNRRLIEVSLPLKAISAQSAREKSIRHGHVSTLHIWWARRPLAAMRMAMALGADVSALVERQGILKQSGETVHLLGPKQRAGLFASRSAGLSELGLPDRAGRTASVIDVLHRAATLWESGDREDQVRLVAQTLINVLPDEEAERRLLEGFLAGRDMLTEAPRQERLF
jgi:hypothetical protein